MYSKTKAGFKRALSASQPVQFSMHLLSCHIGTGYTLIHICI